MKRAFRWLLFVLVFVAVTSTMAITVTTFNIVDYIGVATAPSNPTSSKGRLYYNSALKTLACLNSDGTNCMPAGSGAVTTSGNLTTNTVPKASGAQQLTNSAISDNGTTITLGESTSVTGNLTVGGANAYIFSGNGKILSNGTGNILLESNGSGAISRLVLGNDAAGNAAICPNGTGVIIGQGAANCTTQTAVQASNLVLSGHLNQSATARFAGSCAMSSGTTCTFSIGTAFSGTPLCFVTTDAATTLSATAIEAKCSLSTTTVTVTAGASNSRTWDVFLIGNPT